MQRLQKILAHAGIASRRKCEQLILSGAVQVNGETVTQLGQKVHPEEDVILVHGKPIHSEHKVYLMLNKPRGVITSVSDPKGRKVVTDFVKGLKQRVYPVGRLDYDTEGLLFLTNDGEFANLITHPKYHIPKTYVATVKGIPHGSALDKMQSGIMLEDGMTAPAQVDYQDVDMDKQQSVIQITIYEGRNRQIRRMFEAIAHPVIRLKRIAYGEIFLNRLKRGCYRPLTAEELRWIKDQSNEKK